MENEVLNLTGALGGVFSTRTHVQDRSAFSIESVENATISHPVYQASSQEISSIKLTVFQSQLPIGIPCLISHGSIGMRLRNNLRL
jgi:hypothetical protein